MIMEEKQIVLEVKNVKKWYEQRNSMFNFWNKSYVKAVDKINFELAEGEVLGVIGESGCGKSTLGRVLVQLEKQTDGDIFLNGESVTDLIKKDKKTFKKNTQIIFQNPFDSLPPKHTIERIMMRPLEIHNIGRTQEERYQICVDALESGGLFPAKSFLDRYPHELSGGQLQRISILRAMLLKPTFLVADEPTSMLDVSVRAEILNMLINLTKKSKTALIFISHDIASARYISDRIAVMYLGRIVEIGETDEVIQNPQHPYTQTLISNCFSIDINENREPIMVKGEPPTPVDPGPGCYFANRCIKAKNKCLQSYPEYVKAINKDKRSNHIYSCFY